MSKLEGNLLIAQGGGPTAVINQSLAGVALEARKFPQVRKVYGARHGIEGILNEDFLDLSQETTHNLEQVSRTPGSALGSTRIKPTPEICKKIFEILQAHGICYFFYIGGNDSAEACRIVNEEAEKADYELRCIHVPKTIDNDLTGNDHTPGFGSAARFVANAFSGANLDNRALPGVYIGVVMGRHSGFLTASSALAKKYPDDGPHLIYLPERVFDIGKFTAEVEACHDTYGRCIVAVSEGIRDASGRELVASLVNGLGEDHYGNAQLSGVGALGDLLADTLRKRKKLERVRADTLGYLQRSFTECVSDIDQGEAREVGERAAHYALWHDLDGSIAIERTGNYSVNYHLREFEAVAGKTRVMPDHFIDEAGTHVTDEFLSYVRPLVGSAFPAAHRLRAPAVDKVTGKA